MMFAIRPGVLVEMRQNFLGNNMLIRKVQRLAAVASAALLAISALAPLDANSEQWPRSKRRLTPAMHGATLTPAPETIFEAMQPCRAIATGTSNGGGAIAANTTRDFYVSGTTGFDTQGGASGGCGVPASATAVAISLTALATPNGGSGKVIAYIYGNPVPSTVSLSFAPNIAQTSSVILGVNLSRISLQAKVSSVQINGDITGYFIPQIQAFIISDGTLYSNTSRVLSVSHPSTGSYVISIDRDVFYCASQVSPAGGTGDTIALSTTSENKTVSVTLLQLKNGAFVPANDDFNFSVHC